MNYQTIDELITQYCDKAIGAYDFAQGLRNYGVNEIRARWHNKQMFVSFLQSKNNIGKELHKVTLSPAMLDEQKQLSLAGSAYWASGISTDARMPQEAHKTVFATELLHKHKASHKRYAL